MTDVVSTPGQTTSHVFSVRAVGSYAATSDPAVPEVSVVVPFHNERDCLSRVLLEIEAALGIRPFEVIAVDDRSTDGSAEVVSVLAASRPWIRLVQLPLNQGQTAAMAAGIAAATGSVIVTMDADGQNDPADIPALLLEMELSAADVVAGRRRHREEGLARRTVSNLANGLCRWITGVELHDSGCSLKAFRAEVLQSPTLLRDDHRFLPALVAGRSSRIVELDVNDRPRFAGQSHYGFGRIPKVAVDLLGLFVAARFRGRPLRAAGWLSLVLATVWTAAAVGLAASGSIVGAVVSLALGFTVVSVLLVGAAVAETLLRWPVRASR